MEKIHFFHYIYSINIRESNFYCIRENLKHIYKINFTEFLFFLSWLFHCFLASFNPQIISQVKELRRKKCPVEGCIIYCCWVYKWVNHPGKQFGNIFSNHPLNPLKCIYSLPILPLEKKSQENNQGCVHIYKNNICL